MTLILYRITPGGNERVPTSASSLDEATRELSAGFYTTFATLAGGMKVLGLRAHLQRLYVPARGMEVNPAVDEKTLWERLASLVRENLPGESRVRLVLTRDTGSVYAAVQPFEPPPDTVYKNGVRVITTELARHDPHIKDTNFIAESMAQRNLLNRDVFEVLLTKNGKILEGMTSNFYVIKNVLARAANSRPKQSPSHRRLLRLSARNDIRLVTARHGILPGVTRRIVLRLARGEGMSIEYRAPGSNENFDEAFLTSSSRGVVPIVSIDDSTVGEGGVGAWTKALGKAYQAYVVERSEEIMEGGE